jgi:hypothetical protein
MVLYATQPKTLSPADPCNKVTERVCAMQLAFQQSGAAFNPIPDEVVTAAFNRPNGGRNEPGKFEWPALLRKLDRVDPSYKQ